MNKKVCSIILLCLIFILFIFTIVISINSGVSLYRFKNVDIERLNDKLPPSAFTFVGIFATFGLWIGFVFIVGTASVVGFLCSLINIKIAQNIIIRRMSKVFVYLYSAIFILLFMSVLVIII